MHTRTKIHEDGRREIIRMLSASSMDDWKQDDPLAYEKSIVWLEDVEALPYVRVAMVHGAKSRRGPLHFDGPGRLVGYAKLLPDAPKTPDTNTYSRRIFYVREADQQPSAEPPAKAVDPKSIFPGVAGEGVG